MKKMLLLALVALALVGCKKAADVPAGELQVMKPLPAVEQAVPATSAKVAIGISDKYKKLLNDTAISMFDIYWSGNSDVPYVPQAIKPLFGLTSEGVTMTSQLDSAVAKVKKEVDEKRRESVSNALAAQKEVNFIFDLATLSEPNRKAAKYLVEAGYWMHELYKLQLDKDAPITSVRVLAECDPDSIRLYNRNAGPFCGRYGDKDLCSILPDYTTSTIGAIMWPDDVTETMVDQIKSGSKDIKNDPLLSSYTVVKKGADGNLTAIPYSQFEPFKPYLEKIAALMEQASDVEGIDPTFANQLKLQAKAFRSVEPKPFFESDEAWGKTTGELEVIAGPYETYQDPYGMKAFYEYILGMEDKPATEIISKFMPLLPQIEQAFALTVGGDTYKARNITAIPPIRVIRVISATGESRKAGGPSIALSLPNIGPMAEEGRAKRVVFANHHDAKYEILSAIAQIAMVPEQLEFVSKDSFVLDSSFHEIMHGIGPQRENKVGDSTVSVAIGENYDGIEEAKANVGGIWAAKVLADNKVLTEEQLKSVYTTYVAGLFRIMRFGAGEAHARGAALEFGYLFANGAIEEKNGRFAVNYEKMPVVLSMLVAEIGKALTLGDKAAVAKLLDDYPKKIPSSFNDIVKKIADAKIARDVALTYEVVGM